MGTYDDSKVRRARTDKTCVACRKQIYSGTEYLDYRPGMRVHTPVHLRCAIDSGNYDCEALHRGSIAGQSIVDLNQD